MKRVLVSVAGAALALVSWTSSATPALVDLDAPGALERLQAERPEQYLRVIGILHDAQRLPDDQVAGWLQTTYRLDSVRLGRFLLTSYPPKRRLSFSLEQMPYEATIVVRLPDARLVPGH